MPSKTNYADLTLYDGVLDEDKYFKDFRVDIAGVGNKTENSDTRSNFQKIDDILSEHIPNNALHRKTYDISASKNSETENSVTYLAVNVQNFDVLSNGMLFILSVDETNAKNTVYIEINNDENIALMQKFNSSGQLVDLVAGDLIANVKYLVEYDHYHGRFILISPITATEILDRLKTVDGSNSGLDSDLLDGQHGSYYATAVQGAKADSAIQSVKGNGTEITPDQNKSVDITPSNIGAVPTSRKVNNKELTSDITLDYSDIGTVPIGNGGTGATTKENALSNLGLTYQTGTWTPTLGTTMDPQPTYTMNYVDGRYVRIGALCYVTFYGKWTVSDAGPPDDEAHRNSCIYISGLPFPAKTSGSEQAIALREATNIKGEATIVGKINAGTSRIEIKCKNGSTVTKFISGTEVWFGFSGIYCIHES